MRQLFIYTGKFLIILTYVLCFYMLSQPYEEWVDILIFSGLGIIWGWHFLVLIFCYASIKRQKHPWFSGLLVAFFGQFQLLKM